MYVYCRQWVEYGTVDRGSVWYCKVEQCPIEQFYSYQRNGVEQDCSYVRVGLCRADCNK